jgi:hypothetical protein
MRIMLSLLSAGRAHDQLDHQREEDDGDAKALHRLVLQNSSSRENAQ